MRRILTVLATVMLLAVPAFAREVVLHDFETETNLRTLAANGAVLELFELSAENVASGESSAKLVFDLTDPDQSWSEVNLIVDFPDTVDIEGAHEVSLWVHGDGTPHVLYVLFYDGFVEGSVWTAVDWEGWRLLRLPLFEIESRWNIEYVRMDRLQRVRVVVGDGAGTNKTKGVLWIDRLAVSVAD